MGPREIKARKHARFRARQQTLERDQYRCQYCLRPAETIDHMIPLSRGGRFYDQGNRVASCMECNLHKADMLPSEFLYKHRSYLLVHGQTLTEVMTRIKAVAGDRVAFHPLLEVGHGLSA